MNGRMTGGQTINDRLLAAKHSLAGQGLAKAVCKATTEELIGPKKKHLDYLTHCTNEPNVSIPQMANLLIERSQNSNWIVVYKALVTVHHIMCYGNERFTQYLASSNCTFHLNNFFDKSGVQGYDMSPFIRRYANYLNEKALSYRTVAFDFCKAKRGKEDGTLRTMNAEKLLKTLPVLQSQLDSLLKFDCSANDLTNGVINMCFMLLFRDLIRLFACYNDGIINLLENYFDMNKKQCKDALEIYKKFLVRMDKVAEFLKVAENVGIDKGDIPDLTKAPSSLLDALEQHLSSLEGKKVTSSSVAPPSSNTNQKNVKSGMSALSSTSTSFGTAAESGPIEFPTNGIDETLKLQALAEEEAAMRQFQSKKQTSSSSGISINSANPFLSNGSTHSIEVTKQTTSSKQTVDFLGSDPLSSTNPPKKASDDLLFLGGVPPANPFLDLFGQPDALKTPSPQPSPIPSVYQTSPLVHMGAWDTNGQIYNSMGSSGAPSGGFVSENNFSTVFGNTEAQVSGFDSLGGVLQPASLTSTTSSQSSQPQTLGTTQTTTNAGQQQSNGALLTGDLESSLASLAQNLTISTKPEPPKGGIQWTSPKGNAKAGNTWTPPQPLSGSTTSAGYKPMNQSMPSTAQQPIMQPPSAMYTNVQPMAMRPMFVNTNMYAQRGVSIMPTMSPSTTLPQRGQQQSLFN